MRSPITRFVVLLCAALVLASGVAPSQVNDVRMGLPSIDYADIEPNSANNKAVFQDRFIDGYIDGNAWVARLDPKSGTFVSVDGRDLFIDDNMSTFCIDVQKSPLCSANYAEWVTDSGENKVLYSRLEGNQQRVYMRNLHGGPRELVGPSDGISRHHLMGTNSSGGRAKVVYRRWMSDQRWRVFWLDMSNPTEEILLPDLVFGGGPPQWIGSRYILYQARVGQVVQLVSYDTLTRSVRNMTDDPGDKYGPYSWQAPELGGGRLVIAEAIPKKLGSNKYKELRLYWLKAPSDTVLSRFATLKAPKEAGAFSFFSSPEPFVYKNHTYISLILSPEEDTNESQVWVFSVPETSGGQPYAQPQRVGTSTITAEKLDPESYVTPYGAFIYYWYADVSDGNRIKLRRTIFEPVPPQ
jgi:hypothetical protein